MIITSYKELVTTIVESMDLINVILKNHHRRTAVIAYHLGKEYGLNSDDLQLLVMSAAVHDVGALTIVERDELLKLDVENPFPHSYLGSIMLEGLPYLEDISELIRNHHLKWKYAYLLDPHTAVICNLLHLADRIDILLHTDVNLNTQANFVFEQLNAITPNIFSAKAVSTYFKCSQKDVFWLDIDHMSMQLLLNLVLSNQLDLELDLTLLESFAQTLSKIIDFRSEFTATHSQGVSAVSYTFSKLYGLPEDTCIKLRIAGLLHDIGKLGISAEILEKKGPLSKVEYNEMKTHSYYTYTILSSIQGIKDIARWASAHHEKQDGTGYPFRLKHKELGIEETILAFSDVFTALIEERPYRVGMNLEEAIKTTLNIFKNCEHLEVIKVFEESVHQLESACKTAQIKTMDFYHETMARYLEASHTFI